MMRFAAEASAYLDAAEMPSFTTRPLDAPSMAKAPRRDAG
jgi:hypothetical protein